MEALEKLIELDVRHNELLAQLDTLDAKITQTLHEWTSVQKTNENNKIENLSRNTTNKGISTKNKMDKN